MYGTVYGMRKTTLYLPDDLKAALERTAAAEEISEAELIRDAIRSRVTSPRPRVPLTGSGLSRPDVAERADELLAGFGER